MDKKPKDNHEPAASAMGCCRVESLVTVDERGQMVLPKDVRERVGIHAGDKLAVVSCGEPERSCCILLVKTDELAKMVKDLLGPLMKEIIQE